MGPTASGKSALALALAERMRRRDRQRRFGAGLPRHGHRHRQAVDRATARAFRITSIDIVDPTQSYSAARISRAMRRRRSPTSAPAARLPIVCRRHDALLQGADRGTVGAAASRSRRARRSSTRARRREAGPRCMPSSRASIRTTAARLRRPTRSASSARSKSIASTGLPLSALQGDARGRRALRSRTDAACRACAGETARRCTRRSRGASTRCSRQGLVDELRGLRERYRARAATCRRCAASATARRGIPRRRIDATHAARARESPRRASSPSASSRGCASTPATAFDPALPALAEVVEAFVRAQSAITG